MIITPHSAAGGEVTGSAYLLETKRARVLVDCGLFQGGKKAEALNKIPGGPKTGKVDAVLITHAHLDHAGRLPLLTQCGYEGAIFATPATIQLARLVLRDSAKVQRFDAERRNGIANLTTPCGAFTGSIGISCDVSAFSDDLHPSARAHRIIGNAALVAVPEPSTLLLLGFGFLGVGLTRSRRKS